MGLAGIASLATEAMDSLMCYHWPGNVRELGNAVERALILSRGRPHTFPDLQATFAGEARLKRTPKVDESTELDTVVSRHIKKVLEMTAGTVHGESGAARQLNVNPSTLRKGMGELWTPPIRGHGLCLSRNRFRCLQFTRGLRRCRLLCGSPGRK